MLTFLLWVFIGIPAICVLAQAVVGLTMSAGLVIYALLGGKLEGDK